MGNTLVAIIVIFLAWDAVWWLLGVKPLFPWQLRKKLRAGAAGLVLLDVRTPPEYAWFHLPGALNLPDVLARPDKLPLVPPSQTVVVICMTGHRSPFVSLALKKRGFPRVRNLTGGMVGWKIYEWCSRVVKG
ncbi:MAG: rhodanese-like domain-containing protein [Syntrophobacterales bacterium]|jgi:rhodanese-related sulfurtransferase|nr:rhodanese-like domain-containing protein [Syntrophobacterales bacterium]